MSKIQEKRYEVRLNLEELRLLDGKVSADAQAVIDKAIEEASVGFDFPIMNEIIQQAKEKGTLTWRYKSIRSCSHCDKTYDYVRYKRNSRYHNKGDKNFDKPMYYRGIKFNEGFVTMQGVGDMCMDCCNEHHVIERLVGYIVEQDVKIEIQKNDYTLTKYLKDNVKTCYECKKEMFESEMGRRRTMMGDGTFPAVCLHCQSEAFFLGNSHKTTQEFRHILNPAYAESTQEQ